MNDLISAINAGERTEIELGCGTKRARPGYLTIDLLDNPAVDLRMEVREAMAQMADNSITAVFASHFIEHVDDLDGFLREIVRVCRDGARIEFIVPHFSNPYFYSDITHRTFFGLYTFSYLAEERIGLKRKVPRYARIPGLCYVGTYLGFGTLRDWRVRFLFRKGLQRLVNASRWSQELYEDAFTGWVPAYEVRNILSIDKKGLLARGD